MSIDAVFENISERIVEEISKASQSIYIAVAWFTNERILEALVDKAADGCIISLIISNDDINNNGRIDHERLNIGRSKVYRIGDGEIDLMHNKFCVIDRITVISGSYNWSYKADTNLENVVVCQDPDLARQFIHEFNRIRKVYYPDTTDSEDAPLPLESIIKRLEVLKNLVLLEELVQLKVLAAKLEEYDSNEDIITILSHIKANNYAKAVKSIEAFIAKYNQLSRWTDPEIAALKLEIKNLENCINAIDNERISIEKLISEFEYRHSQELGDIILELLKLRKQQAKKETKEYKEAEKDERDYKKYYQSEQKKNIETLTEEQKAKLKSKFRKASMLCHPDKYSTEPIEVQKEAERIFKELNNANAKNDLKRVMEILEQLEKGDLRAIARQAASDKQLLQKTIEQLKLKLAQLEAQLADLINNETYLKIDAIEDWDIYFEHLRGHLQRELDEMLTEEELLQHQL